ncbi:hypothetical protein ACFV9E_41845 [Streptomyces sp. NPDC059835]|uniref:hypothetical protein n=1 Tax=Streptomyces sp. NPDC059835 TaxID=3346967 RepID=UPI00365FCC86
MSSVSMCSASGRAHLLLGVADVNQENSTIDLVGLHYPFKTSDGEIILSADLWGQEVVVYQRSFSVGGAALPCMRRNAAMDARNPEKMVAQVLLAN